jgi:hypothetical protein
MLSLKDPQCCPWGRCLYNRPPLCRPQGRVRRRGDLQRRLDEIARQQASSARVATPGFSAAQPTPAALPPTKCQQKPLEPAQPLKGSSAKAPTHQPTPQKADAAEAMEAAGREAAPLTAAREAAVERRTAARAAAAQREGVVDARIRCARRWGSGPHTAQCTPQTRPMLCLHLAQSASPAL